MGIKVKGKVERDLLKTACRRTWCKRIRKGIRHSTYDGEREGTGNGDGADSAGKSEQQ